MTNREIAEMIAKFRTHPSFDWKPLADDIELVLNNKDQEHTRIFDVCGPIIHGTQH